MDSGGGGGAHLREKPVKVRVQIDGVRRYLGYAPTQAEADQMIADAKEEFDRTGHISAVSCSQRGVGTVRNNGAAYLWFWSHFEAGREDETFEENVMRGVMRDAVIVGLQAKNPRVRAEARAWISRDDDHLYAFATICRHFGVDVEAARDQLLEEV